MSNVFYMRATGQAISAADVIGNAEDANGCFQLHRVKWQRSFLAEDGSRMMCWYRGPDAESARNALRELGSDMNAIWSGHVYPSDQALAGEPIDLLVELRCQGAVPADEVLPLLQRTLPAAKLLAGVQSLDGERLVALYQRQTAGPAALSLEGIANGMSVSLWPCQAITPPG